MRTNKEIVPDCPRNSHIKPPHHPFRYPMPVNGAPDFFRAGRQTARHPNRNVTLQDFPLPRFT